MMNTMNKPRPNIAPTEDVITQAINLCVSFGSGDSTLANLLNEMKSIQEYNVKVLKDANDAYNKTLQSVKDLGEKKVEFDERVAAKAGSLEDRSVKLLDREGSFQKYKKTNEDLMASRVLADRDRKSELESERREIDEKIEELREGQNAVKLDSQQNLTRARALHEQGKKLDKVVAGLKSFLEDL